MAESNLQTGEAPREEAAVAVFRRQIRFWLIVAALLALFIYVFSEILLPFVAGMVLAYFLDPVADRLERAGLSRVWATIFILFAFVVAGRPSDHRANATANRPAASASSNATSARTHV